MWFISIIKDQTGTFISAWERESLSFGKWSTVVCLHLEAIFFKRLMWGQSLSSRKIGGFLGGHLQICNQRILEPPDLAYLLAEAPFAKFPEVRSWLARVNTSQEAIINRKWWGLSVNGCFIVKSFYNLLNDGGNHCSMARFFWESLCPKKINIFNWLVWKKKVLSLENLGRQRYNQLPTDTCVLCHAACEFVDHLFIHYRFAQ